MRVGSNIAQHCQSARWHYTDQMSRCGCGTLLVSSTVLALIRQSESYELIERQVQRQCK